MRITKLVIAVFVVILFVFGFVALHVSTTSTGTARVMAQPQASNILIADGTDPMPAPWHK